ncbi:MBL fold metallo-hydrolase [Tissierella sp.]|uniref:MBL fold metallo-hydrolase n=1 Tax=Tissierella sp. TaxID=41274 RepID=UPI0028617C50|nr:MBL fold metallo-hydrolase [Tissierella sp.]MDR7856423.1 MBL fold metallo-hydrolase [Tissierella sp.]
MKIIRIPAGIYAANCYIIFSDNIKEGIIVDPGGDADEILSYIRENDIKIKYIILTHGHGDHIGGVAKLKDELKVPVMIHEADRDMLVDGSKNLSSVMAMGSIAIEPDRLIKDGDCIAFGDLEAKIIHTPGHTQGGICIMVEDNIITGDTLFAGSIGRTDLFGGDFDTIIKSIKEKLMNYADDVKIHPGHGGASTIGKERISNPFLK